jgi:membrane fusion protein (multidrug efflux system)
MKTLTRILIALALLGVIFGGIFGYKLIFQTQGGGFGGGPQAVNITATTVAAERWRGQQRAVGSLVAVEQVAVSTEVAGIIESIGFTSGAEVSAGDTLIELDDRVDRAELEGLEAQAALARIEFERAENLLPQRAISQSQFDEARARLDSATAAARSQEARIQQKSISAPFDGVLGIRNISVGQFLAPGTEIVELRRLDPIYVDFSLPERFLPNLQTGQTVQVSTSAYDERFEGEITAIDSGIAESTRSVSVRATLTNTDARLRPGMFARVTVLEPMSREVLTIPRTAVNFNTYGDFALRINETDQGRISEQVQIRTGEVRDGRVEVLEGLSEGDRVVSAGLVKVRPGQPVTIDESVSMDPSEVTGR